MSNEWQWYAVRCCCTPTKIFGFLRLPAEHQTHYLVREKIKVRPLLSSLPLNDEIANAVDNRPRFHDVRLKSLSSLGTDEIAIYSEDRPIEFWRNIEGFIEVEGDK